MAEHSVNQSSAYSQSEVVPMGCLYFVIGIVVLGVVTVATVVMGVLL